MVKRVSGDETYVNTSTVVGKACSPFEFVEVLRRHPALQAHCPPGMVRETDAGLFQHYPIEQIFGAFAISQIGNVECYCAEQHIKPNRVSLADAIDYLTTVRARLRLHMATKTLDGLRNVPRPDIVRDLTSPQLDELYAAITSDLYVTAREQTTAIVTERFHERVRAGRKPVSSSRMSLSNLEEALQNIIPAEDTRRWYELGHVRYETVVEHEGLHRASLSKIDRVLRSLDRACVRVIQPDVNAQLVGTIRGRNLRLEQEQRGQEELKDALLWYFTRIARFPVLNRDEEVQTARELRDTRERFMYSILRNPVAARSVVKDLERISSEQRGGDQSIFWMGKKGVRAKRADVSELSKRVTDIAAQAAALKKSFEKGVLSPEQTYRRYVVMQVELESLFRLSRITHHGLARTVVPYATAEPLFEEFDERPYIREQERRFRKATEDLTMSCARLAAHWAKRFAYRGQYGPLYQAWVDLIGYANVGLMYAIERFDVSKGFKLSTYATWWIRRVLDRESRALQLSCVNTSLALFLQLQRLQNARKDIEKKTHREVTITELAEAVDLDPAAIEHLERLKRPTLSLDVHADNELPMSAVLQDPRVDVLEAGLDDETLWSKVSEVLTRQEVSLLTDRYVRHKTIDDVAEEHGLDRHAVRHREVCALAKLVKAKEEFKAFA